MAGDEITEDLRQESLRQNILHQRYNGRFNDIFIFKMNTHFTQTTARQKATGCHENYLTLHEFEQEKVPGLGSTEFCEFMTPFLMSRQIFDGAGGIYWSPTDGWQYVISQRSFFIGTITSTSTTDDHGRGLINFRSNKPELYPPGLIRLHLHCGDLNMSPIGKYIAVGATHLVLRAWEENDRTGWRYRLRRELFMHDFQKISADPLLKTKILLTDSSRLKEYKFTAIDLQKKYLDYVTGCLNNFSEEEQKILASWTSMVEKLDKNPMDASRELDWLIKLRYLQEKLGGNLAGAKARFASSLYHDISPAGIYNKLLRCGRVETFASQDEITAARLNPPGTRAEFRSRHIKAIKKLDDADSRFTNWGTFSGIDGDIAIPHPLDRTSEKGEAVLAYLEKLASRKK